MPLLPPRQGTYIYLKNSLLNNKFPHIFRLNYADNCIMQLIWIIEFRDHFVDVLKVIVIYLFIYERIYVYFSICLFRSGLTEVASKSISQNFTHT